MGIVNSILINKCAVTFDEQMRYLRVALYKDILNDLISNEYFTLDEDLKKVLAMQSSSYLLGDDLEQIYNNSDDEKKQQINSLSLIIESTAQNKMLNDEIAREVVVYANALHIDLMLISHGDSYLQNHEKQRKQDIITKYGSDLDTKKDIIQSNYFNKVFDKYYLITKNIYKGLTLENALQFN